MSESDSKKYVEDGYAEEGYFAEEGSSSPVITVDSSTWTGEAPRYEVTEQKRLRIVERMNELNKTLNEMPLDQEQKAQAGALVAAALLMADAPQPPWEIIKEILMIIAAIAAPLAVALQIGQMIK